MASVSALFGLARAKPSRRSFPRPPGAQRRGQVRFDAASCALCRRCAKICPAGAIRFEQKSDGIEFSLQHARCVACGLCIATCESDGLSMRAEETRPGRVVPVTRALVRFLKCAHCGKQMMPAPAALMARLHPGLSAAAIVRLQALCPQCRKRESPR